MTKRIVTIYSTQGSKDKQIESEATTWGELQRELEQAGVTYEGMKAIVGESEVTLESAEAQLPVGLTVGDQTTNDFTLFLTPVKVKSGSGIDPTTASYAELRTFIKNIRKQSEKALKHFGDYTHSTTEELRKMVKSWLKKVEKASVKRQKKEVPATQETSTVEVEEDTIVSLLQDATSLIQKAMKLAESIVDPEKQAEVERLAGLQKRGMEIRANLGLL